MPAEFQAVIMAGGNGTRMYPLVSDELPKAILPMGNYPMIASVLNMLERLRFDDVIVIAQESAAKYIQHYVEEISGLKIKVDMQTIPNGSDMGTADALRTIKDKIKTDFIVLSCDLISNVDILPLIDLHRAKDSSVTCLFLDPKIPDEKAAEPVKKQERKDGDFIGIDSTKSKLVFCSSQADHLDEDRLRIPKAVMKKHPSFLLRSDLVDAHLYVFSKWIIDYIAEKKTISTIKGELIPHLVRKQFSKSFVVPADDDRLSFALPEMEEVANNESFDAEGGSATTVGFVPEADKLSCYAHVIRASKDSLFIRANTVNLYSQANKSMPRCIADIISGGVTGSHPSVTYGEKTKVSDGCLIGEGVVLGERCSIKGSVVGKHCVLGDRVKIQNSVIMDHVNIKSGCQIINSVICKNAHVQANCQLSSCQVGFAFTVEQDVVAKGEVLLPMDNDDDYFN